MRNSFKWCKRFVETVVYLVVLGPVDLEFAVFLLDEAAHVCYCGHGRIESDIETLTGLLLLTLSTFLEDYLEPTRRLRHVVNYLLLVEMVDYLLLAEMLVPRLHK